MIGPVVFVVMLAGLAVLASRCPEVNDDDLVVGPVDVAEWRWWEDAVVTLHRVVVVTQAVVETLTRFDAEAVKLRAGLAYLLGKDAEEVSA